MKENDLIRRFEEEYKKYQKNAGALFPKIKNLHKNEG